MAEESQLSNPPSEDMEAEYGFEDKVGVDKDLTGDGGVVKRILRKGEGWEVPEAGDEVSVHYVGTLLSDGSKFDSSRDRGEPFTFKLGAGRVIKGWDTGVATMKKGELATLTCAPAYAYGAAGHPPTIPADATLVFEVELLSWKSVKDLTGDGGVVKTLLAEGKGWQTPKDGDEVALTYVARVVDPPPAAAAAASKKPPTGEEQGLPVAASSPEGGALFDVAAPPCSGLGVAAKSMKPQERARLLLSPAYAAGLVDVPEGKLLEVEATLTGLHAVTHPAPGVTKKVLVEPEGAYARPNAGSTVRLRVSAAASGAGGQEYEAPHDVEYVTDDEKVPEGLELAVATMREGERAAITVSDPALTAAPPGAVAGAGVPPGTAPVVYDVTLTGFDKAKERWEMNNAEKLAAAQAAKERGNAAYKAGHMARAVRQYGSALEAANAISERDLAPTLPGGEGEDGAGASASPASVLAQAREVKKACALNLAAAELKRSNWGEAAKQAGKVLELDPSNVKALYRRAQAHMALGDLLEAELDIKAGLLTSPDNTDLAALQRRLKVKAREANKKEAKLYGRMFAALGKGGDQGAQRTAGAGAGADAGAAAAAAAQQAAQADEPSGPAPMQEDAPAAPVVQAAA